MNCGISSTRLRVELVWILTAWTGALAMPDSSVAQSVAAGRSRQAAGEAEEPRLLWPSEIIDAAAGETDERPRSTRWPAEGHDAMTAAALQANPPFASAETVAQDAIAPQGSGDFPATWFGYDHGFALASSELGESDANDFPFRIKLNGWGQIRIANFVSSGPTADVNQIQLKRARLLLSGHVGNPNLAYFIQLDGRSSSGDVIRLLDYFVTYDLAGLGGWDEAGRIQFRLGKYKMPFSLARYVSGRELQFADRSIASAYFDVNRSLAIGLSGDRETRGHPWNWEAAVFNGLVTGGAETGSAGTLDNNFAVSFRATAYPHGSWGENDLADWEGHATPATRFGFGVALSTIDRSGSTEFDAIRVVDSGAVLSSLLPAAANEYKVAMYAMDASIKYRGGSLTGEYYLRNVSGFVGITSADLFDHGFWLQAGYFVVPQKLELFARWSRVVGESGSLGAAQLSSDDRALGGAWYFRGQDVKLVLDATYLNGAPIDSPSLDIVPGDRGWLIRTQVQVGF